MRLPLVLDGLDARRDPNAAGGRWQHAPPCPAKGIRPPPPATQFPVPVPAHASQKRPPGFRVAVGAPRGLRPRHRTATNPVSYSPNPSHRGISLPDALRRSRSRPRAYPRPPWRRRPPLRRRPHVRWRYVPRQHPPEPEGSASLFPVSCGGKLCVCFTFGRGINVWDLEEKRKAGKILRWSAVVAYVF